MGKKHISFFKRFEICNFGCWNWTGGLDRDGYGHYYDQQTRLMKRAHRVSWSLYFGDIPEGLCVLHKCDNPKCVNPEHLFLGPHQENMDDRVRKNRSFRPYGNKRRKHIKDSDLDWIVGELCKM